MRAGRTMPANNDMQMVFLMFVIVQPNVAFSRGRACRPGLERYNPLEHLPSKGRNASVTVGYNAWLDHPVPEHKVT